VYALAYRTTCPRESGKAAQASSLSGDLTLGWPPLSYSFRATGPRSAALGMAAVLAAVVARRRPPFAGSGVKVSAAEASEAAVAVLGLVVERLRKMSHFAPALAHCGNR